MMEVIVFFMIIAAVVSFPYSKVYHRLNRIVDAQKVLTGAALIAFPVIWLFVYPVVVDAASPASGDDLFNRFTNLGASMAQALCWLMAFSGILMIGFAIWEARESLKKILAIKGKR